MSCNFEAECSLQQDDEDDEDWVRLLAKDLPGVRDHTMFSGMYIKHQASNIRHTKSQNLNVPRQVLQLILLNPLKAGVKSRMKM